MSSEVMDFINSAGSGAPSFPFDNIGDTLDGVIAAQPRIIEKASQKNPGTMDKILCIDIRTNSGDEWTLMCGVGGRVSAIRDALQKAGATGLQEGGRLVMKYVSNAPKKPGQPQAAKVYQAAYQPPAPSGVGVDDLLAS